MEAILKYIRERYHPTALILYGSYADGTNGPDSDFDALAIAGEAAHDVSTVAGVRLDLYIYPAAAVSGAIDCEDFVQLSGENSFRRRRHSAAASGAGTGVCGGIPSEVGGGIGDIPSMVRKNALPGTARRRRGQLPLALAAERQSGDLLRSLRSALSRPEKSPSDDAAQLPGGLPELFPRACGDEL